MTRAILLVSALGFGCFSQPEPPPAPAGLRVDGAVVTWPAGMKLGFGDPLIEVPMPNHLSLADDRNLIAPREAASCLHEDQVGVAVYPIFTAAARATLDGFTNLRLDRLAEGPAYALFRVGWERAYACGAPTPTGSLASGSTRFGMFPDGRIVRVDDVAPATTQFPIDACTGPQRCASASTFIVKSYTAFARDEISGHAVLPDTTDDAPPPAPQTGGSDADAGGCLRDLAGGRLALRWGPVPGPTRFRSVTASNGHDELVFVADLYRGEMSTGTLPAAPLSARTTLVLDPGTATCAELLERAAAVASSANLLVEGTPHAPTPDQIYDLGEVAGTVTLSAEAAVPGGFVVALQRPGTALTTSRGAGGVLWQRDPATDTFHVWFRDPLVPPDEIRITVVGP